jgi:hypothetical protein
LLRILSEDCCQKTVCPDYHIHEARRGGRNVVKCTAVLDRFMFSQSLMLALIRPINTPKYVYGAHCSSDLLRCVLKHTYIMGFSIVAWNELLPGDQIVRYRSRSHITPLILFRPSHGGLYPADLSQDMGHGCKLYVGQSTHVQELPASPVQGKRAGKPDLHHNIQDANHCNMSWPQPSEWWRFGATRYISSQLEGLAEPWRHYLTNRKPWL